jgi:hypothetical protein
MKEIAFFLTWLLIISVIGVILGLTPPPIVSH